MSLKIPFRKVENAEQAYTLLKGTVTEEYLAQFNIKADFTFDDSSRSITAKGKGFKLNLTMTDTEAVIDLELGMLLKAFKGKINSTLETKFKEVL